jgi:hypothetical protein
MHLAPIIAPAAKAHGVALLLSPQCNPVIDFRTYFLFTPGAYPNFFKDCAAAYEHVLSTIRAHPEIDLVIMAASWNGAPYMIYRKGEHPGRRAEPNPQMLAEAIDKTLAKIEAPGRRVVLLTSVPQWPSDPLPCELTGASLLRRSCPHDQKAISKDLFEHSSHLARSAITAAAAEHPGLTVVRIGANMCRNKWCVADIDGEPLYRDASHLRRNLSDHAKQKLGEIIGVDEIFTQPSPQITQSR